MNIAWHGLDVATGPDATVVALVRLVDPFEAAMERVWLLDSSDMFGLPDAYDLMVERMHAHAARCGLTYDQVVDLYGPCRFWPKPAIALPKLEASLWRAEDVADWLREDDWSDWQDTGGEG